MRWPCRSLLAILIVLFASLRSQAQDTTQLAAEAQQLRYDDLARDLGHTPPGLTHDLFAGVLANRSSRFDESIRLLTPIAAGTDIPPDLAALTLGALADDFVKTFHYAAASRVYDTLFAQDAAALSPELLKDDQDDNATLKLLLNTPPQTIEIDTPVDLPTHSDPIGSFVTDLTVNRVTASWILDTGANFSTVSESFAKQIGVNFSTGVAETMGATGAENTLHVGVLSELNIGGATLHNVVFLILPDANLTIPLPKKKTYTIPAILGYPVFQSLGIIRFTHDHHFLAGPALQPTGDSSAIYFDKLTPLIACVTHDRARLFMFDSGANATSFFLPYFRDFSTDFGQQKLAKSRAYGAGGIATSSVYLLNETSLQIAGRTVTLHHIAVRTTPVGDLADRYEGSLGRDLLDGFTSLTLDFTADRAYLGDPLPPADGK